MKPTTPRTKHRQPMAWSVGNQRLVGPKASASQPRSVRRWRARAHAIWECVAETTSQVEEGDRFLRAVDDLLSVPQPARDEGAVWTTGRQWQVWEPKEQVPHQSMLKEMSSRAAWMDAADSVVVWNRPYDFAPRWHVRGTVGYCRKLAPQQAGGGDSHMVTALGVTSTVGSRQAPLSSTGGSRQAPLACRRAAGEAKGAARRRRKKAVEFVPPEEARVEPPAPRRKSWGRRAKAGTDGKRRHVLETLSGTAWSSAAEYLQDRGTEVDAFLIQETHLPPARAKSEEDWCKARRLKGTLSAATPSGEGGWQGGVGVVVRDAYGMAGFPSLGRTEIAAGRVILVHLSALVRGGYALATVYLWTAEGLSARNLSIMDELGAALSELSAPFVIGGDWNLAPEVLEASGWVRRLRARVVAPAGNTFIPTAAASEGAPRGSKLDYFVISEALMPYVEEVPAIETELITQHRPVRLVLRSDVATPIIRAEFCGRGPCQGRLGSMDRRGRSQTKQPSGRNLTASLWATARGAVRPPCILATKQGRESMHWGEPGSTSWKAKWQPIRT